MKPLPDGLKPFNRTPEYTSETVPSGLLKDHSTKAGVWGVIQVTSGELVFRIKATGAEHRLSPGHSGTVEPETLHSVEPIGDATFFVEFWRADG